MKVFPWYMCRMDETFWIFKVSRTESPARASTNEANEATTPA